MPLKSLAQMHFLFANKPGIAKEFAAATPKSTMQNLPKYAGGTGMMPNEGNPGIPKPMGGDMPTGGLAKGSYAAPKWATNPWGEMIKRRGLKNLRNTGF